MMAAGGRPGQCIILLVLFRIDIRLAIRRVARGALSSSAATVGIEVSYETIRRWVSAFGPRIARRLQARRPAPHRRWHLDEMFVRIGSKPMYLWRAVDAEGEVLEVLVQARRRAESRRTESDNRNSKAGS